MRKQVKIIFYTKEEMCATFLTHNDKVTWLKEPFLTNHIEKLTFTSNKEKIGCPFCKNGFLELREKQPEYSDGGIPDALTLHIVGYNYRFNCSNDSCGYKFFGRYIHTHIN